MISKDARLERIDINTRRGIFLLQQAMEYFRKAYNDGSGMAETLLQRTKFSLFMYDCDTKNKRHSVNSGNFK